MRSAAPSISMLGNLHTEWMNGIQFYLSKDEPIIPGRILVWIIKSQKAEIEILRFYWRLPKVILLIFASLL
jgi:hypothetical protein